MSNKDRILSQIHNVKSYIDSSDIEVAESFIQKLSVIENDINNFRVYLPLIGGFNAGKSSLINSYLNSDELLPTNIISETAVATELYFSSQEKIEVYQFDNQAPIQVINSLNFEDINTDLADYLKVYINSPQLQKYTIILVDMPGLDSNLKRHNQSILSYMAKDVSFVLVLNIEDGTIRNSTLQFLKEIKDYRLDFFTILNKIDKKLPNDVAEIKKHIQQQVSTIIDKPYVGTVSALDNEIVDFKSIIENINVDEFIQKLFDDKAKDVINSIIFDLGTRRDTISLDVKEIDEKISNLLSNMRDMNKEFDSEKRKVENKFSQTLLVDILRDVEYTLKSNIHSLMEAIDVSNEHLNAKINDLIRPVITSKIKNFSEAIFAQTITNIEIQSNDLFESVTSTIDQTNGALLVAKTIVPLLPLSFAKVITSVLTKINPIVAVVSTVVAIVASLFGKSKEEKEKEAQENRKNQIRQHLENVVIPSIPNQIAPSIQNSLNEIKDNFFVELREKFDEKGREIQNSLTQAKQEKESKKDEIESQKEKYTVLINQLKDTIKE